MRPANISSIPGWLLRISKNRIEISHRDNTSGWNEFSYRSLLLTGHTGDRHPSLRMPMTAKFPTFPSRSNELSSIEILFFFSFFFIVHRQWKMYTAILIRIAIRIQRARNESITRVTRSCHFSPINCDFFFSHLVSFRISLDNEKDILRRLMNGKDSRSRLNLSEYIARASRCSDFQLLSFSLSFFSLYSFQSSTRPRIQMGANRKHLG